jgi:hypothetical protein
MGATKSSGYLIGRLVIENNLYQGDCFTGSSRSDRAANRKQSVQELNSQLVC